MLKFLKQLLRLSTPRPAAPSARTFPDPSSPAILSASPSPTSTQSTLSDSKDEKTTSDYFGTMGNMQEAVSKRDYERAARLACENLRQVPAFVRSTKRSYGSFDISSVPALEVGGTLLALVGDDEGLAELRRIVTSNRDLDPWIDTIEQHEEDRRLFTAILEAVQQNPGCRQKDMKSLVGIEDGRRLSTLIGWLEKAGKITREKQGKTYAIWPAGAVQAPELPPKRNVRSHRLDRNPPQMREIDVARIPYVPLPRSPLRWEEARPPRSRSQRTTSRSAMPMDGRLGRSKSFRRRRSLTPRSGSFTPCIRAS